MHILLSIKLFVVAVLWHFDFSPLAMAFTASLRSREKPGILMTALVAQGESGFLKVIRARYLPNIIKFTTGRNIGYISLIIKKKEKEREIKKKRKIRKEKKKKC